MLFVSTARPSNRQAEVQIAAADATPAGYITTLNSLITQLNRVIAQAQADGVTGISPVTIQPITPSALASRSTP